MSPNTIRTSKNIFEAFQPLWSSWKVRSYPKMHYLGPYWQPCGSDTKSKKSPDRSILVRKKLLKHFLTIILCSRDLQDHEEHDRYLQYTIAMPCKCYKRIQSRFGKSNIFYFCRRWAQPEVGPRICKRRICSIYQSDFKCVYNNF